MAVKLALFKMLLDSNTSDEDDFMRIMNALHAVGEENQKTRSSYKISDNGCFEVEYQDDTNKKTLTPETELSEVMSPKPQRSSAPKRKKIENIDLLLQQASSALEKISNASVTVIPSSPTVNDASFANFIMAKMTEIKSANIQIQVEEEITRYLFIGIKKDLE
ncbi:hypothetical protein RN001_014597 [Aquatica leii]|uniref:Uncharacterized protein n=1 Tax=Aquatica leii TaxID=1421715 RepID=A0AAN7QBS8_9COLE|nr:hypothetical protein RN001_014597 [Aquatica leii]